MARSLRENQSKGAVARFFATAESSRQVSDCKLLCNGYPSCTGFTTRNPGKPGQNVCVLYGRPIDGATAEPSSATCFRKMARMTDQGAHCHWRSLLREAQVGVEAAGRKSTAAAALEIALYDGVWAPVEPGAACAGAADAGLVSDAVGGSDDCKEQCTQSPACAAYTQNSSDCLLFRAAECTGTRPSAGAETQRKVPAELRSEEVKSLDRLGTPKVFRVQFS